MKRKIVHGQQDYLTILPGRIVFAPPKEKRPGIPDLFIK
jgi:hypothetical protein